MNNVATIVVIDRRKEGLQFERLILIVIISKIDDVKRDTVLFEPFANNLQGLLFILDWAKEKKKEA